MPISLGEKQNLVHYLNCFMIHNIHIKLKEKKEKVVRDEWFDCLLVYKNKLLWVHACASADQWLLVSPSLLPLTLFLAIWPSDSV